ncbi:MAG: hypothetical protein HQM08_26750 [Candidatus Riflebacteria bacterium]|nr:hypothetical protein [Candidatus Riflebacteria bacterium]
MKNEIMEELWKIKDELAQENDFDVAELVKTLRKKEKRLKGYIVDFSDEQEDKLSKKNKAA